MRSPKKSEEAKIDLYKLHKQDYVAPLKPALVNIKRASYLAIGGVGEPGGKVFTEKVGALYGAAFTIKMARKFAGEKDYVISKLEALWWGVGGVVDFFQLPRKEWHWKLLIRTSDFVQKKELEKAVVVLLKRGKDEIVREVSLEEIVEGQCVQMLHVGSYKAETATITLMKAYAEKNGLQFAGLHHEIYLSDPRRVAEDKLKTILRYPVK